MVPGRAEEKLENGIDTGFVLGCIWIVAYLKGQEIW